MFISLGSVSYTHLDVYKRQQVTMSDGGIEIDFQAFYDRFTKLGKAYSGFEGSPNSLLFVLGSTNEENPYQKTTILHNWLLGYEFPATLIAFFKDKGVIITSSAKAKHLLPAVTKFEGSDYKLEIWQRNNKDANHNKKLFEDLIKLLSENGNTVGVPTKDSYQGKLILEWKPLWEEAKKTHSLNVIDCSAGLSSTWKGKDDKEKAYLSVSSKGCLLYTSRCV